MRNDFISGAITMLGITHTESGGAGHLVKCSEVLPYRVLIPRISG